jgi:acyl-CoA thioester hydrolase
MTKISLDQFKVRVEYAVQWGDMDAARHVNNLVYLRWAESSRLAYFEHMGINSNFSEGVDPILGWQDCKYIFPMVYPDTAIVGVRAIEIKEDRFVLESAIFSKVHERIAAISRQSIVPYDYVALRKAALPEEWLIKINTIDQLNS